jgi:hypothetical protein
VGHWYAYFSCEVPDPTPLPPSEAAIGIDLGVLRFATLSDGTQIENPRWYRKQQATIARLDTIKNRRVSDPTCEHGGMLRQVPMLTSPLVCMQARSRSHGM